MGGPPTATASTRRLAADPGDHLAVFAVSVARAFASTGEDPFLDEADAKVVLEASVDVPGCESCSGWITDQVVDSSDAALRGDRTIEVPFSVPDEVDEVQVRFEVKTIGTIGIPLADVPTRVWAPAAAGASVSFKGSLTGVSLVSS